MIYWINEMIQQNPEISSCTNIWKLEWLLNFGVFELANWDQMEYFISCHVHSSTKL